MSWDYRTLKSLLQGESLPAMLVDLDILDQNTQRIASIAKTSQKKLRIASKSVRVPALLARIMEVGGEHFQGLMCYCAKEASFLASRGFDDLLIAYPTVQTADLDLLWELREAGTAVVLMLDSLGHVERLQSYWASRADGGAAPSLPVCVDVDMSYRPLGLHLGVQRSSVRSFEGFRAVLGAIQEASHLELSGLMGYEAQIAGLGDQNPFAPLLNPAKKLLKKLSVKDVSARRKGLMALLDKAGIELRFFNGGGTGSLRTTTQEPWITEVTAGSGFLQSHLFDYYEDNANQPAFCFALQVTREPQPGVITCHSGGFIASGETGQDKSPLPFLPGGLETLPQEGFGEVQTPLYTMAASFLGLGDPVFFRPAKAGEIAERFDTYLLLQDGAIVDRVPTYRGCGQCFF